MKKMSVLAVVISWLIAASATEKLQPLPGSKNLNTPERFDKYTSGMLSIVFDKREQAVRFDVNFQPNSNFWCAPRLWLTRGTLTNARIIRFDFKAKPQEGKEADIDAFLILDTTLPKVPLPKPTSTWKTVTVDLTKIPGKTAEVNHIAIAMKPQTPTMTYWIRNLEILAPASSPLEFDTSAVVKADAPGAVFIQGETLEFRLDANAAIPEKWELTDWQGRILRSGS